VIRSCEVDEAGSVDLGVGSSREMEEVVGSVGGRWRVGFGRYRGLRGGGDD
jgi:hypothetical protein